MSLMDSVFDIRAALQGKPEAKLFEEVEGALWSYENELNQTVQELHVLKAALVTIGTAMQGMTDEEKP